MSAVYWHRGECFIHSFGFYVQCFLQRPCKACVHVYRRNLSYFLSSWECVWHWRSMWTIKENENNLYPLISLMTVLRDSRTEQNSESHSVYKLCLRCVIDSTHTVRIHIPAFRWDKFNVCGTAYLHSLAKKLNQENRFEAQIANWNCFVLLALSLSSSPNNSQLLSCLLDLNKTTNWFHSPVSLLWFWLGEPGARNLTKAVFDCKKRDKHQPCDGVWRQVPETTASCTVSRRVRTGKESSSAGSWGMRQMMWTLLPIFDDYACFEHISRMLISYKIIIHCTTIKKTLEHV